MKDLFIRTFGALAALSLILSFGVHMTQAARTQVLTPTASVTNGVMYFDGTNTTNAAGLNYDGTKLGVGTSTPQWMVNLMSSTAAQLVLSAGAGFSQWALRSAGGSLYISTTTVAGTATSTIAAETISSTGSVAMATSSLTGQLNLGMVGSTNGTTTIATGKWQIDGYNSAGTRECSYLVGTTFTVTPGACNP